MAFLTDDYYIPQQSAPPPPPFQDDGSSPLDTPDEILAKEQAKRKMAQDPMKRLPYSTPYPPGSAQQRLSDWSNQGPPPPPKPKAWQRIAAGVLAGGAGYLNANAGRPGGISKPVDVQPGVAGILGIPQYERNVQNWKMQGVGLDQAAQQERYEQDRQERAREADMRDKEALQRIKESEAASAALEEQRRMTAEERKANADKRRTENLQRYQTYSPTTDVTPAPLQAAPSGPPVPSTLQLAASQGPPPALDNLPLLTRSTGMSVPTPPPSGYVAADRPEGGDPSKSYALPTLEQEDRMKRGVRAVPADLKDFLPFDEAPDADIRDALKKKADEQRIARRDADNLTRQREEDDARERRQNNSLDRADVRAANSEALRLRLQNDLQDAVDARQARGIYSKAVEDIQKQTEAELARVDQEYGGYAQKNNAGVIGQWFGGAAKGSLSKEQQTARDQRIAQINQRKEDALKAADQAFAPYKSGAPGPPPGARPPGRTPPPAPQDGPQSMNGHSVGDKVKLKDGREVVIKSFNKNGTFNY